MSEDLEQPREPIEPTGELLSLEQLANIPSDPETEKKVAQAAQLVKGTYNSVTPLLAKPYVGKPGSKNPGRIMVKYFGQFLGTGDVTDEKGYAAFWVSTQAAFREDGKPDGMTVLYNDAKRVYRQAMGLEKDAVVMSQDVLAFLEKYPVAVNFSVSDGDSNFVNHIIPAREL